MQKYAHINIFLLLLVISTTNARWIHFFLYTPKNQTIITAGDISEHLDKNLETLIIVHGWHVDSTGVFATSLKDAFFSQGDFNIVLVDHSRFSEKLYSLGVVATPIIANRILDLIMVLLEEVPLNRIHMIGHSLGAQICGYVGTDFFKRTKKKLPKITALDPAGPLFEFPLVLAQHLEKSCAEIVVVIYTCRNFIGVFNTVGTTNIYANGGFAPQPGCSLSISGVFYSHSRSWVYYVHAVKNPGTWMAAQCKNYLQFLENKCNTTKRIDLGGNITIDDEGKFYLDTTAEEPFRSIKP